MWPRAGYRVQTKVGHPGYINPTKARFGGREYGSRGDSLPGTRARAATDQDRAHGCRPCGPRAGRRCSAWSARSGRRCCAEAGHSAPREPACPCAHSSGCTAPIRPRPTCQGTAAHVSPVVQVHREKAACSPWCHLPFPHEGALPEVLQMVGPTHVHYWESQKGHRQPRPEGLCRPHSLLWLWLCPLTSASAGITNLSGQQ